MSKSPYSSTTLPHGQADASEHRELVALTIAGQTFGIPVLQVQDILGVQVIAPVHLAPPEVAGSLNLRGRIVTAVDIRARLGLPSSDDVRKGLSIVVEHGGELYSLLVDGVGDVMSLGAASFERNPTTLDPRWREVSAGIYRLDGHLLVVLDIARLLDFTWRAAA